MKAKYFLELLLLSAIWGSSFMFIRIAVPELGPWPLVGVRMGIAALTIAPLVLLKGELPVILRYWPHMLLVGIISTAIPFLFLTIATQYSSAGFAAIINSFTPIWSAVIGWVWLREYLSARVIIGIFLSFLGMLVMVTDSHTISSEFLLLPILAGILATFSYALTGNYTRRFLPQVPSLAMAGGSQCFSFLCLLPFMLWFWPETSVSARTWISMTALGMICTGFALIMYFHLLKRIGVANTVLVTYMAPVFAMLWGKLVLQETITSQMLGGAAFILSGTALTTGILRRRKKAIASGTTLTQGKSSS